MDVTTFQQKMDAYTQAIEKPVVVLYTAERNSHGPYFNFRYVGDTEEDVINFAETHDIFEQKTLLIVKRYMAADGSFWLAPGVKAPEQPTSGLLRKKMVHNGSRLCHGLGTGSWEPVHSIEIYTDYGVDGTNTYYFRANKAETW
jgi:hypothetical protein